MAYFVWQTDTLTNHVRRNLQPQLSLFRDRVKNQEISNHTVRESLLEQLHYMRNNISEVLLINVEDIAAKVCWNCEVIAFLRVLERIKWFEDENCCCQKSKWNFE